MTRHPDVLYTGTRLPDGSATVRVDGRPLTLPPSLRVRPRNQAGFDWGYQGAGPDQLALALVLDATGDRDLATRCYRWFRWAVVAGFRPDGWRITAAEVRRRVAEIEADHLPDREKEPRPRVMPSAEAVKGGGS